MTPSIKVNRRALCLKRAPGSLLLMIMTAYAQRLFPTLMPVYQDSKKKEKNDEPFASSLLGLQFQVDFLFFYFDWMKKKANCQHDAWELAVPFFLNQAPLKSETKILFPLWSKHCKCTMWCSSCLADGHLAPMYKLCCTEWILHVYLVYWWLNFDYMLWHTGMLPNK